MRLHQKGKRIAVNGPSACMVDIWDNPTTKYLTWGEGTTDEMRLRCELRMIRRLVATQRL